MNKTEFYQQQIEDSLKGKTFGSSPAELYKPIEYIMTLGGKRMRPVLVLMACELFDGDLSAAIHPALAVELFHNFTLVHDDIMDKAPLRRNQATVHEKWNDNIAILSGDAMMVCAYQELCKSDAALLPDLLQIFNETALKVCEGQQFDMNYETQRSVSIPQYLKMIELKTAVLLGAALKLGAITANASEKNSQLLYEFGKHIGIAFQLQDDILDVYADASKFGKQKGGDIIANKKTYLLLKAMEMAASNRYLKEELEQWINAPVFENAEKVEAVTKIYDFLKVKDLARAEMSKHYEKAKSILHELQIEDNKKNTLQEFSEQLMVREI